MICTVLQCSALVHEQVRMIDVFINLTKKFYRVRPDLAIVSPLKIVVGELTVCHETSLIKSLDYKLQKYSNIEAARSSEFCRRPVKLHTIEQGIF